MARAQLHHRADGDLPLAQLSSALAEPLALRRALPADEAFLQGLLAEPGATASALADPALDELLAFQYEARHHDLEARFPCAEDLIVLEDGEPIGRIWIDAGPNVWRILDLALIAARRGAGIAGAILRALLAAADERRREVALSVERSNEGAIRLYRRLGFLEKGGDAIHLSMLRPAGEMDRR